MSSTTTKQTNTDSKHSSHNQLVPYLTFSVAALSLTTLVLAGFVAVTHVETNQASATRFEPSKLVQGRDNKPVDQSVPDDIVRLIVKFKDDVRPLEMNKVIEENGNPSDFIKEEKLQLVQTRLMDVLPEKVHATIRKLETNPLVEYVEKDEVQFFEMTTSDPIDQWEHTAIQTSNAWPNSTGNNVKVAVCDTGVQSNHPDLEENLLKEMGYDIYRGTGEGWDTTQHPHGTMVAGTIAQIANNNIGGRGVSFDAKIIPLKVSFDATGGAYLSTLASCIRYGSDTGAAIINVSYEGVGSRTISNTAKYATDNGSLVVYAAGNSGTQQNIKNDPNILVVSATDQQDRIARFSNFGNYIDVSAPGVNVFTTSTNSGYAYVSGTSFSSPITAGVAALIKAINPTLTPAQIQEIITSSSDDLGSSGYDIYYGHGRVNASNATTTNPGRGGGNSGGGGGRGNNPRNR